MGDNHNLHTGEHFFLDHSHVEDVRQLELEQLSYPEKLMVMLQTGDETLDYRQSIAYYQRWV